MSTPTKCQCDKPGFCPLMNREMSKVRHAECKSKPHYFEMFLKEAKSVGLGDTVAKVAGKLGIRKCGGCAKRQTALNRWFPYRQ